MPPFVLLGTSNRDIWSYGIGTSWDTDECEMIGQTNEVIWPENPHCPYQLGSYIESKMASCFELSRIVDVIYHCR
jgi:hypothetical protein